MTPEASMSVREGQGSESTRDARGRFQPGQSGNPAGKRPGTRNRATLLRELLEDGDVDIAVRILRDKLAAGDGVVARFILDRLFPKPRDRAIDLGLPGPEDGTTFADLFDRALCLMAAGEITIDEASRIVRLIHQRPRSGTAASEPAAGPSRGASAPAFDLQTAGDAPPPNHHPNRHARRRAAALQRAAAA